MASVLADYTAHEVFNVHQFACLRIQLYRHYNSLFCECQENNSLFGECFCLQKSILEVKIVLSIGKQVSDIATFSGSWYYYNTIEFNDKNIKSLNCFTTDIIT